MTDASAHLHQRLELEIAMLRSRLEDAEQLQRAIIAGEVDGFVVCPPAEDDCVMLLSPAARAAGSARDPQVESALQAMRNGEIDGVVVDGDQVMLLGDAHRPYQAMIDRMQQGAVTISPEGEVLYVNEPFAAMAGVPREELLGRDIGTCVVPADHATLRQVIEEANVDRGQAELSIGRADDGRLPVLVTGASTGHQGSVILMFTGLTEQRRHHEIAESDRRKDEFLAVLAHELRNPLAPIRNAVQILVRRPGLDPVAREVADIIERQSATLTRLLDDLLDIKRLSHGKLTLRKQHVDLKEVVRNAVETAQPLIDERHHALDVDLPGQSLLVQGDPVRLMQVVLNLVTNAAKYTPPGGHIRVGLRREPGGAGAPGPDAEAVLRVADDGIGIPEPMLHKVFEPYAQLGEFKDAMTAGLGLGLTVARQLLELHGGSITPHSDGVDKGSEFVVRLPLDTSASAGDVPGTVGPAVASGGLRILVADDNADGAHSLAMLLQMSGHEARTAHDGLEALHVADAFLPQVAFLDLGMPKLDGYGVARALREREWAGERLAIFALTGWNQPDDRRLVQEAGFDAHLVKPFDAAGLELLIESVRGKWA